MLTRPDPPNAYWIGRGDVGTGDAFAAYNRCWASRRGLEYALSQAAIPWRDWLRTLEQRPWRRPGVTDENRHIVAYLDGA